MDHQQPHTLLPEINVSSKDDWDFLSKPVTILEEEKKEQQLSDSESKTTGLTRALSLPRQLDKPTDKDSSIRTEVINIPTTNPSHLFWVPASQHPEIAPAEFEKYVDTHGINVRKKSAKRRQSVLSVYFTANDQQKLVEECDTAEAKKDRHAALDALESKNRTQHNILPSEEEEDIKKRKLVLRRSVSLHLPTTGDYPRNVPDLLVFDRNSSPLDETRALVPKGDRPLLRRGARTKFKRNSSVSGPQRNRKSASDCMDSSTSERLQESGIVRSASAEGVLLSDTIDDKELTEEPFDILSSVAENEGVGGLSIAARDKNDLSPSPSPSPSPSSLSPPTPLVLARSVSSSTPSSIQGRKSAWSWAFWSDEKSSKKNNKIDPNASTATLNTTASTPSAGDEKLNESTTTTTTTPTATTPTATTPTATASNNKRFTLSSLFSRKSKHNNRNNDSYTNFDLLGDDPKKAPKDFQLNRMHMTRLPLHVERNIYKLSHVKLANPRRPLHEQVLISNQMFWYLSVIATNSPHPALHAMSMQEQPKKKIPRKRLVKKQRPASTSQQPHYQRQQQAPKKRTHTANQKGNTTTFMAIPRTAESTGFVVPENYLNPQQRKQQEQLQQKQQQQQQQQQHQQQINKKPILGNNNNTNKKTQMYHKQQQQGSDSSSSDNEDDDDDEDEDEDDEQDDNNDDYQENIPENRVVSHKEKEDELPLAMYKANAYKKKKK